MCDNLWSRRLGVDRAICQQIINKQANYVISLKGNQGNLHNDVRLYFDSIEQWSIKSSTHHTPHG